MRDRSDRLSALVRDAVFLFIALAPATVLLAVFFVRREDPVYVWDFRFYWTVFQHYGELIASGAPWRAEALASISADDYNPAAAILLAPLYTVLGGSREIYVSALATLYLLPAALLAALLATCIGRGGRFAFLLAFLLAVLFVPFWRPTLRGMVDIVALLPLGCATLLILFRGHSPAVERLFKRAIVIGTLLWIAFLFRRHFAYTIVVLFALFAAVEASRAYSERNQPWTSTLRLLATLTSVVVFIALAILLQWELFVRAVTTDYSSLYQAYQMPFASQIEAAVTRLGFGFIALAGLGVLLALQERNSAALASFFVAATTFLLFSRTQAMADHHFLPVAFFLFPLIALPIMKLVERGTALALALAVVMPLFGAVSFATATVLPGGAANLLPLVPQQLTPIRLERIASYRDLLQRLDEMIAPEERIVMFASSAIASDELFRVLQPTLSPRIVNTPHIGEVSLFDFDQLSAEFAVAFDPLPTHMAPGTQNHLVLANQRLLSGTGFGAAFESTGYSFELASGIRATIFQRFRGVTPGEIDELHEALLDAFPHWRTRPGLSVSRYLATRVVTAGDRYGLFRSIGVGAIVAHPGATTPTVVTFAGEAAGAPEAVSVTVSRGGEGCEAANGVGVTLSTEDFPGERRVFAPGETAEILFPQPAENLMIIIDNNGVPTCDSTLFQFTGSK
jgi:hypothetical protein